MMMRHPGSLDESNEPSKYDFQLLLKLLAYSLPYKGMLAVCFLLLSVVSIAEIGIPYVTKVAIDQYIAPDPSMASLSTEARWDGLLMVFAILAGIHGVFSISSILQMYLIHYVGEKAMFDMRSELYSHIIRMKPAFFDDHPVGKLVTRVANDVNVLREFFASVLVNMFRDLILLAGIIIAMYSIDATLTLVAFSFIVPLVLMAFFLEKTVANLLEEYPNLSRHGQCIY